VNTQFAKNLAGAYLTGLKRGALSIRLNFISLMFGVQKEKFSVIVVPFNVIS
jgi:hypothetical protein